MIPPTGILNGVVILWLTVVVITKLFAELFPWASWLRMVLRVGKATVTTDASGCRFARWYSSIATLPQRLESEKARSLLTLRKALAGCGRPHSWVCVCVGGHS